MNSAAIAKLRLVDEMEYDDYQEEIELEPIDSLPGWKERLFLWALLIFNFACLYGMYKLGMFVYRSYFG